MKNLKYDNIKICIQFGISKSKDYTEVIKLLKQLPNYTLAETKNNVNSFTVNLLDDYCKYKRTIDDLLFHVSKWKSTEVYVNDEIVDHYKYRDLTHDIHSSLRTSRDPKDKFRYNLLINKIAVESLPYPIVYYPEQYGAFFAFGESRDSKPFLCKCNEQAVKDCISIDNDQFLEKHIPEKVAKSIKDKNNPFHSIQFKENLCHKCNFIEPSLTYCHKMYGSKFIQSYGWYVEQNRFVFNSYLNNSEIDIYDKESVFENYRKANLLLDEYQKEFDKLYNIEATNHETEYFKLTEELKQMDKLISKQYRNIDNIVENYTRQEFGIKKIGDKWISETLLYHIVCNIFKGKEILRHYRPDWLEGLELDIFIPEEGIAFEYQGQQHFHPIKAWGGEIALKKTQERDKKKIQLCNHMKIRLYTIDYTDTLSEEYVLSKINN